MSAEALKLPRSAFGRGRVQAVAGRHPGTSPLLSEGLVAVPHLCCPVSAPAVHSTSRNRPRAGIALGFVGVAVGLGGHGVAGSPPALIAVRLLPGAGLALRLVCLRVPAADCARGRAPGGPFGALEFFSKAGAVAAGVAPAAGSARFRPAAPVPTGGAAAAVTVLAITVPPLKFRTRWSR